MKINKEKIVAIFLTLISTFFIWHNFFISGNSILFVIIAISLYNFIINGFQIKNGNFKKISATLALGFTIIEMVCQSINKDYTVNNIIDTWLIINFIGYFILIYVCINWIYHLMDKFKEKDTKEIKEYKDKLKFLKNKYIFFTICFILICVSWVPYLLKYYPGIVTSDSYTQIEQMIGRITLQDHHPIAHTFIVGIFIKIGLLIFKDINAAIALYSIGSIVMMALMDTTVIMYVRNKTKSIFWVIIILAYYMLYPVNGIYSITMWKDVLFSGMFSLFFVILLEMIYNKECFFESKWKMALFVVIGFLTIVLRHNGLYVVFFTIPFIMLVLKEYWKKILALFIIIVMIYEGFNIFIFSILKVEKGSKVEMLSIPLQQVARVEKKYREELTEFEKDIINNIFLVENIGDYYDPILSDPVKGKVNVSYLEEHKGEFIKLWGRLLIKHPKNYVESFIANSYGYYYPEAKNGVVSRATMDHNMGIEQQPKIKGTIVENYDSIIDRRDIPCISMIFSVGFAVWILVILIGYQIYQKNYKNLLVYIPIFILWLTCIASPVFCEYRYAYPIFTTLPIYLSFNIKLNKNK